MSQAQRECELLRRELETVTQIKNNIIIELERSLAKAEQLTNRQQDRIVHLQNELRALNDKNRDLEVYARERSHALTHKNIRIAQLETEIEQSVAKEADKWHKQVQALKTVVAEQEAELALFLEDHHNYLHQLERLQQPYLYLHAERKLILEYNEQLQAQIGQAEQAGVQLQEWALKARQELQYQNQQSNDLLGQVEYMMQHVPQ